VHAVQARFAQHVVEHLHRVVSQDADVLQALFAHQLEQRTDARFVHFAAQEVVTGPHGRNVGGGAAHAEADFHDQRRAAAKGGGGVESAGRIGQQETRALLLVGAGLTRSHAAGAQHITLHLAQVGHVAGWGARLRVAGIGHGAGSVGKGVNSRPATRASMR